MVCPQCGSESSCRVDGEFYSDDLSRAMDVESLSGLLAYWCDGCRYARVTRRRLFREDKELEVEVLREPSHTRNGKLLISESVEGQTPRQCFCALPLRAYPNRGSSKQQG
ncbi:MAG: hypothetical protein KDD69_00325 [Bdellovibrionales bacterium]|nr:hypothetical protein [Bdellovibrionales bacterium]